MRQARSQVVSCQGCGGRLFVLGVSPRPTPEEAEDRAKKSRTSKLTWRAPLLAAGVTLVLVVILLALLVRALQHKPAGPLPDIADPQVRQRIEGARQALADEKFQVALREFQFAAELARTHPGSLTSSESRQLQQLTAEAALLADLLSQPLEKILGEEAAGVREEEWQLRFAARYRGSAVIFDDQVRRDPVGDYHLVGYKVHGPGEPVRLDLSRLQVLEDLKLGPAQRLLFGARLAEIKREAPGRWVIRFDALSGVLLTSEEAAGACCPRPLEPSLRDLLRQQAEWMGLRSEE